MVGWIKTSGVDFADSFRQSTGFTLSVFTVRGRVLVIRVLVIVLTVRFLV